MPRIFLNSTHPKFVFFTNYKVMSSSILELMTEFFPQAKRVPPNPKLFHLEGHERLAICRNPVDRFFSVYYNKCFVDPVLKFKNELRFFLEDPQEKILQQYYSMKNIIRPIVPPGRILEKTDPLYPHLVENFNDLMHIDLHEIILIIDHMFQGDGIDHHFIPQTTFITENEGLMVDHLFKIEEIESHWPEICSILEADLPLIARNTSELVANLTNYSKDDLDENEKRILLNRYKMDFTLLDYQLECT